MNNNAKRILMIAVTTATAILMIAAPALNGVTISNTYKERHQLIDALTVPIVSTKKDCATLFQFPRGETIQSHTIGDPALWTVSNPNATHIYVKPTRKGINTTVFIITIKSTYAFYLVERDNDAFCAIYRITSRDMTRAGLKPTPPPAVKTRETKPPSPVDAFDALNTNYKIVKNRHKVIAVADDGSHTRIRLRPARRVNIPIVLYKGYERDAVTVPAAVKDANPAGPIHDKRLIIPITLSPGDEIILKTPGKNTVIRKRK